MEEQKLHSFDTTLTTITRVYIHSASLKYLELAHETNTKITISFKLKVWYKANIK